MIRSIGILFAGTLFAVSGSVWAQDYPTKPIRLVNPFTTSSRTIR